MTLSQLAQKHNLEPERAKAFLREWLGMQPDAIWYIERQHRGYRDHGMKIGPFFKKEDALELLDGNHILQPLIARPTDLGE